MDNERLARLAGLLDDYADGLVNIGREFDLQDWGHEGETYRGGFLWLKKIECGSAACAVGLACLSGVFRNEGLEAERYADGGIVPVFGPLQEWDAVRAFFGLNQEQSYYLFLGTSYPVSTGVVAARAVATRIRSMLMLHPSFQSSSLAWSMQRLPEPV